MMTKPRTKKSISTGWDATARQAAADAKHSGRRVTLEMLDKKVVVANAAHYLGETHRIDLTPAEVENLRRAFGETRKQFADRLGISVGHYSRIEGAHSGYDPTHAFAARLAASVNGLAVQLDGCVFFVTTHILSPVQPA